MGYEHILDAGRIVTITLSRPERPRPFDPSARGDFVREGVAHFVEKRAPAFTGR